VTIDDSQKNLETESGSASYSLRGYDYQTDVSIWLALELVLAKKLAAELVLEPVSQEDIEGDIEERDSLVTCSLTIASYKLIVQAKFRSGDPWKISNFIDLLNHGKKRDSAKTRLDSNANAKYLLVTSAALDGKIRGLGVKRPGSWPAPQDMPPSVKKVFDTDAAGRVAIVGNEDEERLELHIKELLTSNFRVPFSRYPACLEQLRKEANIRIRGGGAGKWTRHQLEETIRSHDGYFASSPELESYVFPTNWKALRDMMRTRSAALIIGQSGTGKTMATKKLFEELSKEVPGLSRVAINLGPSQLKNDTTTPPVLYDIEDPWGRFDFDPQSRPWNDQLARFFADAHPNKMIVATSRLDVATNSHALTTVQPWVVRLETEHYGEAERSKLYQTRIPGLPWGLRKLAAESEELVLAKLASPLEIQKFFDAIATIEEANSTSPQSVILNESIKRAHHESIEQTVVEQVNARHDHASASVMWCLLKANDKVSYELLVQIEDQISELSNLFQTGLIPLFDFFVVARNLKQTDSTIQYYHPRVEAGVEKSLKTKALTSKKAIGALLEVLVSLNDDNDDWGVEVSTRILAALIKLPELKTPLKAEVQHKIDLWLEKTLDNDEYDFERFITVAAAAGGKNNNLAEVSRYLLHRPNNTFAGLGFWEAPENPQAWYESKKSDSSVTKLLKRFITKVLPITNISFGNDFTSEIKRLSSDLTPAFVEAATNSIRFGLSTNFKLIAAGAIDSVDGYEQILDLAISHLDSIAVGGDFESIQLNYDNGEISEQQYNFYAETEEGFTAGEYIEQYVLLTRRKFGWTHIRDHRHSAKLIQRWFIEISKEKKICHEEFYAAFGLGYNTVEEDTLWHILYEFWDPNYLDYLSKRIEIGHSNSAVINAALMCLIKNENAEYKSIFQRLESQESRLIEISIDVGRIKNGTYPFDKEQTPYAEHTINTLPFLYQEISEASYSLEKGTTPNLSAQSLNFLESQVEPTVKIRNFRVSLAQFLPLNVHDDVQWILKNSESLPHSKIAIKLAVTNLMDKEIDECLNHRFTSVAAEAFIYVASKCSVPLPKHLMLFASGCGKNVRQALADLLNENPHEGHIETLITLTKDTWSGLDFYNDDNDEYPIARKAVEALAKMNNLKDDESFELFETAVDTADLHLRSSIFVLLSKSANKRFQSLILDMALKPNRIQIRRAAAYALLITYQFLSDEVINQLSCLEIDALPVQVSSRFLLAYTLVGNVHRIFEAASQLSTDLKRRVFLILIIRGLFERKEWAAANKVKDMLPNANHPGILWIENKETKIIAQDLSDLGDKVYVDEVIALLS
jgi:hypothetical protein